MMKWLPCALVASVIGVAACSNNSNRTPTAPSVTPPPPPAPSPTRLAISTDAMRGWQTIEVFVNGQSAGLLRRYLEPDTPYSCDAVTDARVVVTVPAGNVTFSARSNTGTTWNGSQSLTQGQCFEMRLNCANRDCSGPAPPPPPVPQPTPGPTGVGYHVWGGQNHTQYLGFFTCVFCRESGSDSINNEFGRYGSRFSSTSIRNQFSQYGSDFSTYSACNRFAGTPPKVYNANQTVYYGELTVNQSRPGAIDATNIIDWLRGDVCAR